MLVTCPRFLYLSIYFWCVRLWGSKSWEKVCTSFKELKEVSWGSEMGRAEETRVYVAPKHGSQALCSAQTHRALLREPVVQDELVGFVVYQ